jgi:5-hydroxyisourate hydrolase
MTVSTRVLDASLGTPAAGVSVTLSRLADGWLDIESAVTGADGRHRFVADAPAGIYCLSFATGAYFRGRSVATFYPEVTITFTIGQPADGASDGHFHLPLLLSPFGYSTYRDA